MSNKTECFSCKGGCGIRERTRIEALKEELAWAIDKHNWVSTNTMNSYATNNLKNKAVFNLNNIVCIAM